MKCKGREGRGKIWLGRGRKIKKIHENGKEDK
jgi:hypothetical protein